MKYVAIIAAIAALLAVAVTFVVLKRRSTATATGNSTNAGIRSPVAGSPSPDTGASRSANSAVQAPIAGAPAPNPWEGLRNMILTLKPEDMGVASGSEDTYGFVMEIGHDNRDTKVTVVALCDGTMSLYLSTGGGTLGTGQRSAQAAQLAKDVVAAVREHVGKLEKTTTFPVAATGHVRFFIMTGQGIYTADTTLSALEQQRHPLLPLFAGGQMVLNQIRLATEEIQRKQMGQTSGHASDQSRP